jgi:hypothetical protein
LRAEYPASEELVHFEREYEMTRSLDLDGVIKVYALEAYNTFCLFFLRESPFKPLYGRVLGASSCIQAQS